MTTTLEAPAAPPPSGAPLSVTPPAGPPKGWRAPPPPPRPPKRLPPSMIRRAPLTRGQLLARSVSAMIAAIVLGFLGNLFVLSHVQHLSSQQQLHDQFKQQLADGTAPVSEGDFEDVLLPDGAPVALIQIPSIGVEEVIVEGTSSGTLMKGPGHRRDTVLPGQLGISVIYGRTAAYGGPFMNIQQLAPGETFTVITGQGEQTFAVMGVRYAGDPQPPNVKAGESRLVLVAASGLPYVPAGLVTVDAELISDPELSGLRQTVFGTLAPEDLSLATDLRTAWALVFAFQFFVLAELAAVWSYRRFGGQKTWIVFVPVILLAGVLVADQINRLLPNLL